MQANLPKTITVNSPDGTRDIDVTAFDDNVVAYVLRYGLQQMLSDSHASITAKTHPKESERTPAKVEKFDAKLASLYAGETAQPRAGGQGELAKEMQTIARNTIRDALRKAGRKADKETMATLVANYIEKHRETVEKAAKAAIAARKNVADGDVDLGDLGL